MTQKKGGDTAHEAISSSALALFKVGAIDEATSLASRLKLELLTTLVSHASHKGWTEADASKQFGVTVPRASELLRSQIDRFSLDDLVGMATRAGLRIQLKTGGGA